MDINMFDAVRRFFQNATSGAVRDGIAVRSAAETYKDFKIQPAPRKQGSQWLTAGLISKSGSDGEQVSEFVRSDMFSSRDDAESCAMVKGRQIIDEQGDSLFDRSSP
jgi:hypothetical protein